MSLGIEAETIKRGREFDTATGHVWVRRLRIHDGVDRYFFGRLVDYSIVGSDKTRFDGSLRLRSTFKKPAFDENTIGALARRAHGRPPFDVIKIPVRNNVSCTAVSRFGPQDFLTAAMSSD